MVQLSKQIAFKWLPLAFVVVFNACSDKLNLMAPYEENAYVFAMLDPSQSIQLVKINKVFSTPDQPGEFTARIADSIFFDSIAPTLTEIETGRVIPLYKYDKILKDSGIFISTPNYLCATAEKIYFSNPKNSYEFYHYRFDMVIPSNKKHISAITNVPDSAFLLSPTGAVTVKNKILDFSFTNNLKLIFQAPSNSKIFDSYFYFSYVEVNKTDTNKKTFKTLAYQLVKNYRTESENSHESVSATIGGASFFDFLLLHIATDTTVVRKFLPCRLELTAGNIEFDNYLSVLEPSIGIVQKQTEYTNINNGHGLFASRRISRYNQITLGSYTKHSIANMPKYKILGFVE